MGHNLDGEVSNQVQLLVEIVWLQIENRINNRYNSMPYRKTNTTTCYLQLHWLPAGYNHACSAWGQLFVK